MCERTVTMESENIAALSIFTREDERLYAVRVALGESISPNSAIGRLDDFGEESFRPSNGISASTLELFKEDLWNTRIKCVAILDDNERERLEISKSKKGIVETQILPIDRNPMINGRVWILCVKN